MSPNTIYHCLRNLIHQVKRLEKQVSIWMIPNRNWSLLLKRLSKKGILTWLKKGKTGKKIAEEAITPPISEKKEIDTVNKTERKQSPNNTVDNTKINKTDTVKALDKSNSTQNN